MNNYKGLNHQMVKALYDECNDPDLSSTTRQFLIELGEPIELRKRVNNYWTFVVKDLASSYSVILKEVKAAYVPICLCDAYQKKGTCKHIYAVAFSIYHALFPESNPVQTNDIDRNPSSYHEPQSKFVLDDVKDFASFVHKATKNLIDYSEFSKTKIEIKKAPNGYHTTLKVNGMVYNLSLEVSEKNNLIIKCSCGELTSERLCKHANMTVFHFYNYNYLYPFKQFYNYDEDKNKLLEKFGLTIHDKEAGDFQFKTDSLGKIYISSIPKLFVADDEFSVFTSFLKKSDDTLPMLPFQIKSDDAEVGIYFQFSDKVFGDDKIKLKVFAMENKKSGGKKYKMLSNDNQDLAIDPSILPNTLTHALNAFSFQKFKRSDITNFSYGEMFEQTSTINFGDKQQQLYLKYFLSSLQKYWEELAAFDNYYILDPKATRPKDISLTKITLSREQLKLKLTVEEKDKFLVLLPKLVLPQENVSIELNEAVVHFNKLVLWQDTLYILKDEEASLLLDKMPLHKLMIPNKNKAQLIAQLLLPMHEKFDIALPPTIAMESMESDMRFEVWLREDNQVSLVLEAVAQYGEHAVSVHKPQPYIVVEHDDKFGYLKRRINEENAFRSYIRNLHPTFSNQRYDDGFRIDFDEVMKDNWFLNTTKTLIDQGIHLVGINELKKFKYNSATPKWNMNISSGIDWFDIKIEVAWDDQVIPFKDLKNAILAKQNFVVLGDGSFGMIPDEWIEKYTGLFKIGVTKDNAISLSKKQFNIIELLFDQIDDMDVRREFEEKKSKLLNLENIVTEPIPATITATLRPYQVAGYQWLQVLDEISWGGCLADDMGLGKTLQAITFLSLLKEKYNNPTSLIICPTSLIYNWENELKKFAPTLKYFIYYGNARSFSGDHFDGHDVVITSYGIARIDVESLRNFDWEYIILDESQAIKNPDAITTKAVQLFKARNKIILSGTPYQNNTFDLFAQFNFLNPGLLGSKDHFRENFAVPIDKEKHLDSSTLLKKMLQPFILRRTKKEVASDLPDKIETIIWCQMNKSQRAVYDEYKDFYRHSLMEKIDNEGMAKSSVYILEGLLRLRQICDDVRLLKDPEIKPTVGVKIEELLREILENSGDHKMLVFSQFTEMLSLIKQEIETNGIQYSYLDGSTPAAKRKELIDQFQTDPTIKVFLISLKAGGVGLNLTAADYVYIVDPWWNPATEVQAIDRVHRIGQDKTVFAYKMICKDSVEEKILTLQENKISISKDLIADGAFFKKLTRQDVEFLFS